MFCGMITFGINKNYIIIGMNILTLLLFANKFLGYNAEEKKEVLDKVKITIVVAVLISGAWGIANNAFVEDIRGSSSFTRFKGSYEPNFMALYVNLAIISLYYIKERFLNKKVLYYAILTILLIMLIMTSSITGFITLGILIIGYLIKNKKYKWIITLSAIAIIVLVAILLKINLNPDFENMGRIEMLIYKLQSGQIDSLSSGRLTIAKDFAQESFDRPILNILFGNGPDTKMIYSEYFDQNKYSHNTYVDFIYNFGVIGTIIIGIYIFNNFKHNKMLGIKCEDINNVEYINVLKVALLITAITLPLSSEAIFLLFFI